MGSERDHLDPAVERSTGRRDAVRPGRPLLLHGRRHQRDPADARASAAPRCCSTASTRSPSTRRRCTCRSARSRTGSGSSPPTRSARWCPDRSIDDGGRAGRRAGRAAARRGGEPDRRARRHRRRGRARAPARPSSSPTSTSARADDKRRPDGTDVMAVAPARAVRPDRRRARAAGQRAGRRRRAGHRGGRVPADGDDVPAAAGRGARRRRRAGRAARARRRRRADAIVAARSPAPTPWSSTSVVEGDTHVGLVVVGADGVVLRQPQLHASARHAAGRPRSATGSRSLDLPWGRLAWSSATTRSTPRRSASPRCQDVDVVAVPFTVADRRRPRPAAARAGRREPAQRRGRQPSRVRTAAGALYPAVDRLHPVGAGPRPVRRRHQPPRARARHRVRHGGDAAAGLRGQPVRHQGHRPRRRPALGRWSRRPLVDSSRGEHR